jgi:type II secretory pathway pseudopilin PulG
MFSPLPSHDDGFTLVEALVALGLIVTATVALLQLFLQSTTMMSEARQSPVVLAAAQSKIEQLRALPWTFDASGGAISDLDTDTSQDPPAPQGGTGLRLSPAGSLDRNVDGFVDHLDAEGRPLGGGAATPGEATYTRRWTIAAVDADADLIELRTCVRHSASPNGLALVCLSTSRARRP